MIWKVDRTGEEQIWYSKDVIDKIKEVVTLDDINCKISKETQNVCDDVLKIIENE